MPQPTAVLCVVYTSTDVCMHVNIIMWFIAAVNFYEGPGQQLESNSVTQVEEYVGYSLFLLVLKWWWTLTSLVSVSDPCYHRYYKLWCYTTYGAAEVWGLAS